MLNEFYFGEVDVRRFDRFEQLLERIATKLEELAPSASANMPQVNISQLYDELLFAVCRKFPNETRHQTALRYIKETELHSVEIADDIECARDWLLTGRKVRQIEIDHCIQELNCIIQQLHHA